MVDERLLDNMMKKTASIFLALLMIVSMANTALAAEKIVQLTVPGCFS